MTVVMESVTDGCVTDCDDVWVEEGFGSVDEGVTVPEPTWYDAEGEWRESDEDADVAGHEMVMVRECPSGLGDRVGAVILEVAVEVDDPVLLSDGDQWVNSVLVEVGGDTVEDAVTLLPLNETVSVLADDEREAVTVDDSEFESIVDDESDEVADMTDSVWDGDVDIDSENCVEAVSRESDSDCESDCDCEVVTDGEVVLVQLHPVGDACAPG